MRFHGHAAAERPAELAPVVLVTEDEVLVRATIANDLREAGYMVVETATADEAIDIFKSGTVIDLVFADVSLPGTRDGYALAEWVHVNRPWIDVLLTTGVSGGDDDRQTTFPVIRKPYVSGNIADQIRAMLALRGIASH